jgi:alpha-glucosidase
MWIKPVTRLRPYLSGDQLHAAFNFDFLGAAWDAARLRHVIDTALGSIGAAAPWVLSNHDVTRHLTRVRADQHRNGLAPRSVRRGPGARYPPRQGCRSAVACATR